MSNLFRYSSVQDPLFRIAHLEGTVMPFQTIAFSAYNPRVCVQTNCLCHLCARICYMLVGLSYSHLPTSLLWFHVLCSVFCHTVPWSELSFFRSFGSVWRVFLPSTSRTISIFAYLCISSKLLRPYKPGRWRLFVYEDEPDSVC